MNKNSHHYEPSDYISKIQTNLKVMKEEVTEYLKKHTIDKVPPILRARHYLLIDAMNDIGSSPQSLKPKKVVKDLSSEKLGHVPEGDRFEPLRECQDQKKQKSKTVKHNRTISNKKQARNGVQADLNCLLPNICNLKLEFDDQNLINVSTTSQIFEEKRYKNTPKDTTQMESQQGNKRYQSIDLRPKNFFKRTLKSNTKETLKKFNKESFLQNTKSVIRYVNNNSQELKRYQDGFSESSKLTQSLKITDRQANQQRQLDFVKFQPIRQQHSQENARDLNQILRNSKQFEEHSHAFQKRKIYVRVNKQLQKGSPYKFTNKNTDKKDKISLSFIQYGKFGSRQISNKSEVFEPWQGQVQHRQKSQFLLQNQIY